MRSASENLATPSRFQVLNSNDELEQTSFRPTIGIWTLRQFLSFLLVGERDWIAARLLLLNPSPRAHNDLVRCVFTDRLIGNAFVARRREL